MLHVITHPALPGPITATQEEADAIKVAITENRTHVTINGAVLPLGGLLLQEHDKFLKADAETLANHRQYRCAYGRAHDTADRGEHSTCQRSYDTDSPYVDYKRIEAIELKQLEAPHPDLPPQDLATTLEQAMARSLARGTAKPTTVAATTVKLLERGHNVFRTIVRSYRLDPSLVPEQYRRYCASCGETPIDKVPLKPPFPITMTPYQPMPAA